MHNYNGNKYLSNEVMTYEFISIINFLICRYFVMYYFFAEFFAIFFNSSIGTIYYTDLKFLFVSTLFSIFL